MSTRGYNHTPESRAKISAALRGHPVSEETRRKISASETGKLVSEETRRKIGAASAGRTHSAETRRKLSEIAKAQPSPMIGRTLSEETRRKIGEASRGRTHTEASRKKISAALTGHPVAEDVRRKLREASSGERAWNWQGGISFEPYCVKFNSEFKERVREFFGRKCVECGTPETGRRLDVHHVNFRKDACCAEDVIPLFVPLCQSCHSKTNFNREYWGARFAALIREQYDGQCYLPKPCAVIAPPAPEPMAREPTRDGMAVRAV